MLQCSFLHPALCKHMLLSALSMQHPPFPPHLSTWFLLGFLACRAVPGSQIISTLGHDASHGEPCTPFKMMLMEKTTSYLGHKHLWLDACTKEGNSVWRYFLLQDIRAVYQALPHRQSSLLLLAPKIPYMHVMYS